MSRTRFLQVVATLLLVFGAVSDAAAERIRCRSTNYRYNFCHLPQPVVRAYVRDRKSDRPCIENRTWGVQRNGIWVNHGCDAEFEVEYRYAPGRPNPGPGYPGGGGGWHPGGPGWGNPGGVPAWVTGNWRSEVMVGGTPSTITIYPNGAATWIAGRNSINGYWAGNDEIRLYNNQIIRFTRQGSRVRASLPGWGTYRFRRVY